MDKEAARALLRVQVAMWLPADCIHCGRAYESVDDWIERNPRQGITEEGAGQPAFVDDVCWPEYVTSLTPEDQARVA